MTNTQLLILITVLVIIYWYWQKKQSVFKADDEPPKFSPDEPNNKSKTQSINNTNVVGDQTIWEYEPGPESKDQILNCPGPEDILVGPSAKLPSIAVEPAATPDKFGNTTETTTPLLSRKQKRQAKKQFRYDD